MNNIMNPNKTESLCFICNHKDKISKIMCYNNVKYNNCREPAMYHEKCLVLDPLTTIDLFSALPTATSTTCKWTCRFCHCENTLYEPVAFIMNTQLIRSLENLSSEVVKGFEKGFEKVSERLDKGFSDLRRELNQHGRDLDQELKQVSNKLSSEIQQLKLSMSSDLGQINKGTAAYPS